MIEHSRSMYLGSELSADYSRSLFVGNAAREASHSVPPVRRTHNVLAEGGLFEGDTGGGVNGP
jgi:hypothetical protein